MAEIQELLPGGFISINNSVFFRREDGKICASTPSNVIINCSKEEPVQIITVSPSSKIPKQNSSKVSRWSFWKIGEKIYPLDTCLQYTEFEKLPKSATFVDSYVNTNSSENDVEIFVKYLADTSYGILGIKNSSIRHVISYKLGYSEIDYDFNYFYDTAKTERWKYNVLNFLGEILYTYLTNRRLLKGSDLSYDSKQIFNSYNGIPIPGGIDSAYTVTEGNFNFIVIKNSTGIYYYSFKLEYILGPVKLDFIQPCLNYCYVAEIFEKKYKKIYCIKYVAENTYECACIESETGIRYYSCNNTNFFVKGDTIYALDLDKMTFVELFKEDFDEVVFSSNATPKWIEIIAIKENVPVFIATYSKQQHAIVHRNALKVIGKSFDKNIFICKPADSEEPIYGISNGTLIFSV